MKFTRQVEILVETRETAVVRSTAVTEVNRWCAACALEVPMITAERAIELASVTPRTIYKWIESGRIHFDEAPDGAVLICRKSLEG
jgi:hypothetical protein